MRDVDRIARRLSHRHRERDDPQCLTEDCSASSKADRGLDGSDADLAAFNARRFTPGLPHDGWEAEIDDHAAKTTARGRPVARGDPQRRRGPRRRGAA